MFRAVEQNSHLQIWPEDLAEAFSWSLSRGKFPNSIFEGVSIVDYSKKFLTIHKNLNTSLTVGDPYYVLQVMAFPAHDYAKLTIVDGTFLYSKSHNNSLYHSFDCGNTILHFHENPTVIIGDAVFDTFIFDDKGTRDKVLLQIKIALSGWKIS